MYSRDFTPRQEELVLVALTYARQGFKVFPLHTPTNGGCSCYEGKDCEAAGKYPRFSGWFKTATS